MLLGKKSNNIVFLHALIGISSAGESENSVRRPDTLTSQMHTSMYMALKDIFHVQKPQSLGGGFDLLPH